MGTTLTFPVDRHHSFELYASTGVQTRTGGNLDLLGIAWQYRWGEGYDRRSIMKKFRIGIHAHVHSFRTGSLSSFEHRPRRTAASKLSPGSSRIARGGGQWPQESRTAVLHCIERARAGAPEKRIDGMEMDIVLTRDGIPVLSHDPWVHTTLCTTASGEPIRERVLIRDKTLEELQAQYLCGGVWDPHFPQVEPKAETIMTLEEVLQALKKAPHLLLYLDLKIDGDLTAGAEDCAKAIARLWEAAGLPNRLYIEGPSAGSLAAYRSAIKTDFVPVLSYPAFSVVENSARTAVRARWLTRLRIQAALGRRPATRRPGPSSAQRRLSSGLPLRKPGKTECRWFCLLSTPEKISKVIAVGRWIC